MFFREPTILPYDMILNVLNRLSLKEAVTFLLSAKSTYNFINDKYIWKKFGAENFEDFAIKIKGIPLNYQKAILEEKYTISQVATMRHEMHKLIEAHNDEDNHKRNEELNACLTEIRKIPQMDNLFIKFEKLLIKDRATMKFNVRIFDGLINNVTPEQLTVFNHVDYLYRLMSDNGKAALNEKLFTLNQAETISPAMLMNLFSDNGMIILRENLMTIEQVQALTTNISLKTAMASSRVSTFMEYSKESTFAGRERAAKFMHAMFATRYLTSNNGVLVLREKLITPEQATNISLDYLEKLINDKAAEFIAQSDTPPKLSRKF